MTISARFPDCQFTVAGSSFDRRLIPLAAFAARPCIGMACRFSESWIPMSYLVPDAGSGACAVLSFRASPCSIFWTIVAVPAYLAGMTGIQMTGIIQDAPNTALPVGGARRRTRAGEGNRSVLR